MSEIKAKLMYLFIQGRTEECVSLYYEKTGDSSFNDIFCLEANKTPHGELVNSKALEDYLWAVYKSPNALAPRIYAAIQKL